MLIIFDLDDTLIDTSGSITPLKIQLALKKMVEAGLVVDDYDLALETFKRINLQASSGRDALIEFLEIIDGAEKFFAIGIEAILEPLPLTWKVSVFDGAIQLLVDLKKNHSLALVSSGKFDQQMYKMKKSGIDSTIFSKIMIEEDCDKGICYKQILDFFCFSPADTLVCGDRVTKDLLPAKELGCITVQIQKGRGLSLIEQRRSKEIDYKIKNIEELKDVIVRVLYSS